MYKIAFILFFTTSFYWAQVVIGSSNVTSAAMLKLDHNTKAMRLPVLSVTNSSNSLTPVPSPTNGLLFYNSTTNIPNNIGRTLTYWSSDNQYHFQGTKNIAWQMINTARIPVLIFSAKIGQKPVTTTTGATDVTLIPSEILEDTFSGWNPTTNRYNISMAGVYSAEFIPEISRSTTGGTLGNALITVTGMPNLILANDLVPFINTILKAFPITGLMFNSTANVNIQFSYAANAANYRLNSGTINIYKH